MDNDNNKKINYLDIMKVFVDNKKNNKKNKVILRMLMVI